LQQNGAVRGRFAPSPTGPLHLGNLRTALVGWLMARRQRGSFIVRMEDLDRVTSSRAHEAGQLAALRSIGLDWDGDVVRQSERFDLYRAAIDRLIAQDLVYECYCTRREIREAAQAPHGGMPDSYPGTCRRLSGRERAAMGDAGRRPALRLRAPDQDVSFEDLLAGPQTGRVGDIVLQRNDGVPAYNLAVVVDDAEQGVTQVVRGADLLTITPSQIGLHHVLGLPVPEYAHVPLVVGPDGERLAKRHGAVTLDDLAARGTSPAEVCARLAASIGIDPGVSATTASELLDTFDPRRIPSESWHVVASDL
jgi:glutamyl-tRNA synthetase